MIKEMLKNKRVWALVLVVAMAATVGFAGRFAVPIVSAGEDRYEKLKVFTEVLSVVERSYVEETNTKDLIYSAIRGLMASLDPHSGFLTAEDYKEMLQGDAGGHKGRVRRPRHTDIHQGRRADDNLPDRGHPGLEGGA
jgi:carboxyl-terminal processing protease